MAYRKRVNKRFDKKVFSRTADRSRALNFAAKPLRGGYRL